MKELIKEDTEDKSSVRKGGLMKMETIKNESEITLEMGIALNRL